MIDFKKLTKGYSKRDAMPMIVWVIVVCIVVAISWIFKRR